GKLTEPVQISRHAVDGDVRRDRERGTEANGNDGVGDDANRNTLRRDLSAVAFILRSVDGDVRVDDSASGRNFGRRGAGLRVCPRKRYRGWIRPCSRLLGPVAVEVENL